MGLIIGLLIAIIVMVILIYKDGILLILASKSIWLKIYIVIALIVITVAIISIFCSSH